MDFLCAGVSQQTAAFIHRLRNPFSNQTREGGGGHFISRRLSLFIKDTSLLVRNSQHSSPLSWSHLIHRLKGPSGRPPGSELEGIM